jgi:hypothetical protein
MPEKQLSAEYSDVKDGLRALVFGLWSLVFDGAER